MNKSELTKQVAKALNVSHAESIRYMSAFQQIMTSELERDGIITLQGFGIFSPWLQTERLGRNPKNGTPCMIQKRMSVKFKPGKQLLKSLNTPCNLDD